MAQERSLAHMPVTVFASVMGLGALTLAWKRAALVWSLPEWPYHALLGATIVVYVLVVLAYAAKWALHPKAARAELGHPMRMPFAPTITIATLLMATALADTAPGIATVLWWIGALGHLLATVLVLGAWARRDDIRLEMITPAWLIPIVGNVVTPLAAHQIGNLDVAWLSFGIGIVFWLGILPVILRRLINAETPTPLKLMPTLAVLVAPPSVSVVSWQNLAGTSDGPVGRMLLGAAWMFAAFVFAQIGTLSRVKFALPYLAYTFPFGALAVASILMAGLLDSWIHDGLAILALAVATIMIPYIVVRVVILAIQGALFQAE